MEHAQGRVARSGLEVRPGRARDAGELGQLRLRGTAGLSERPDVAGQVIGQVGFAHGMTFLPFIGSAANLLFPSC